MRWVINTLHAHHEDNTVLLYISCFYILTFEGDYSCGEKSATSTALSPRRRDSCFHFSLMY